MASAPQTANLYVLVNGKYFTISTPLRALVSIGEVFAHGMDKHGYFVPSEWTSEHFMDKYRRHMTRHESGLLIDESGQPHIIHAAADLLLAWECHVTKENK